MKSETADYLDKAREDLADADKLKTFPLAEIAARSAYYAMFHASEAWIFERTGKVVRTHSGVRTELARLLRDRAPSHKALLTVLSNAYAFKDISDYRVGPDAVVSEDQAEAASAAGIDFVQRVTAY